jgi:hypothetical protein
MSTQVYTWAKCWWFFSRWVVEVCEIGDTLSWSAMRFFVLHLSCCLDVRGWRTSCHKVTSRNFLLSLRALYDMYEKRETSYTVCVYIHMYMQCVAGYVDVVLLTAKTWTTWYNIYAYLSWKLWSTARSPRRFVYQRYVSQKKRKKNGDHDCSLNGGRRLVYIILRHRTRGDVL